MICFCRPIGGTLSCPVIKRSNTFRDTGEPIGTKIMIYVRYVGVNITILRIP